MPNNTNSMTVKGFDPKMDKWVKDTERLVLYADIMGFSERVRSQNHKQLKGFLQKFIRMWKNKIMPLQLGDNLRSVQFSDSILIVVNGTNEKMLNLITKAAVCMMHISLGLGIPIKGVLTQGKFSYDEKNELYFGMPLVEAYNLYNEIFFYGIVVHQSAVETVKSHMGPMMPYKNSLISMKEGKCFEYHLSWHLLKRNLSSGDIRKISNGWLDKIEEGVHGKPRIYINNTREVIENDKPIWNNMSEKVH